MFSIGKSNTPRCFKGMENVPCCYRAQPKSWISSELFKKCFKEIDRNFVAQKRKIALIIDNCPVYPDVRALNLVELIFLPLNATSITQSMNQGVIRSHKAKYHSVAVKMQIYSLEILFLAFESMEFHSRRNDHELYQNVRDFRKINGEGIKWCGWSLR